MCGGSGRAIPLTHPYNSFVLYSIIFQQLNIMHHLLSKSHCCFMGTRSRPPSNPFSAVRQTPQNTYSLYHIHLNRHINTFRYGTGGRTKKKNRSRQKSENPRHPLQKCHLCNFQTKTSNSAAHILKLKNPKSAKHLKSLMPVNFEEKANRHM